MERVNFKAQPQCGLKEDNTGNVNVNVVDNGFEVGVHLYATVEEWIYNRKDTKLIWSAFDQGDEMDDLDLMKN